MRKQKKHISFISERTSEYAMIPSLCTAFRRQFPWVLPLFYWASREGSTMAAQVAPFRRVQVLAVYARRPKLESSDATMVRVRLNPLLFRAAIQSRPYGIPVYAGVPRVVSFEALADSPAFAWFRIQPDGVPDEPVDIDLDLRDDDEEPLHTKSVERHSLDSLVLDASRCSKTMTWMEAMEAIRTNRVVDDTGDVMGFLRFGGYKPFHILFSAD